MKKSLLIAVLAAIPLAACGGGDEAPKPVPSAVPSATATPTPVATPQGPVAKTEEQIKVEQQQVHQSVEAAMSAIPPELRGDFQKVWDCQAKANAGGSAQQEMNGDWIVRKTAELKQNPAIANCG